MTIVSFTSRTSGKKMSGQHEVHTWSDVEWKKKEYGITFEALSLSLTQSFKLLKSDVHNNCWSSFSFWSSFSLSLSHTALNFSTKIRRRLQGQRCEHDPIIAQLLANHWVVGGHVFAEQVQPLRWTISGHSSSAQYPQYLNHILIEKRVNKAANSNENYTFGKYTAWRDITW